LENTPNVKSLSLSASSGSASAAAAAASQWHIAKMYCHNETLELAPLSRAAVQQYSSKPIRRRISEKV
jgi:hypothetical protein